VYGGAVPRSPVSAAYSRRKTEFLPAKSVIGAAAARFIKEGQLVFIDGGTTPLEVATHLPPDLAVTIATHSLTIASALADHPAVTRLVTDPSVPDEALEPYRQAGIDVVRPDAP